MKGHQKLNIGTFSTKSMEINNQTVISNKMNKKPNTETENDGSQIKEKESSNEVTSGFPKHLGNSSEQENKKFKLNEEQESRTIFVGNLPLKIPRDRVTNMFKKYGEVETVRFRSLPVADISLPRKACVKMNRIHEKRTNMNAYVRFKNIESVEKALEMNGEVVNEHTIRVDLALKKTKTSSHAVFIGNLPFGKYVMHTARVIARYYLFLS